MDYVYLDKTDTIQVVNQLKGSPIPISIVSGLVTLTASISGQPVTVSGSVVWGAGTSGEIQVQTMSGDYVSVSGAVSISGNVVITSVSGNVVSASLSGGSISGQMVWGTGTSGQVQVQTTSGSFVTVSGTVITSVSGNIVQVSGKAVFVYVSGGSFSADVSGNVVWDMERRDRCRVYRFRFVGDNFRDVSSFPVRVNYNCVCIRAAHFCRGTSSAHGVAEWNRNVIHVHYDQRVTVLGSRGILGDISPRHFRRLYLLTMLLLWGRV